MDVNPKLPQDPPLIDVKVTNPVTYLKKWWAKVIGNEGVDISFHIKPLTAIVIAGVIGSLGFGVARFVPPFDIPFFEIQGQEKPKKILPTATPEIWKETAYTGTVQFSEPTNRYLLITTSSEALTLNVPKELDLKTLVGKRVLAIGSYNKATRVLLVKDIKNLEILPKTPIPIPTSTPISNQEPTISPTNTPKMETTTPSPDL